MVWAVLVALALAVLAGFERQRLVGEFTSKSATLHRLASQRADQHDAHLTSLSAIFRSRWNCAARFAFERRGHKHAVLPAYNVGECDPV